MNTFLPLCYHYVRDAKERAFAPRILGTDVKIFSEQIQKISSVFGALTLNDVLQFYASRGTHQLPGQLLLTFDDGLSDHFTAARILAEQNLQGVFFIPSCIFSEQLPANPMIVHYGIALFGVQTFFEALGEAMSRAGLGSFADAPWRTAGRADARIRALKRFLKYSLAPQVSRAVLIDVYGRLLLPQYPDMLERMHLTAQQVQQMIDWGHVIGTHSATHISFASAHMTNAELQSELIAPKAYFQQTFKTMVQCMSYPYGLDDDCFSAQELLRNTSAYQLVFTVKPHANTASTSPFELGRLAVQSDTSTSQLVQHMNQLLSLL